MKQTDVRLNADNIEILKSCIGKKLKNIKHDEFTFTNSSLQAVELEIEDKKIYLYNLAEQQDYFGSIEDVAIFTVESEKYPFVENKEFINIPINENIKKIFVIQENQKLFENNEQIYDIWLTRGLIFDLDQHQVAFKKAVWLSEDIYIQKGYNLIEDFADTDEFCKAKNWGDNLKAECFRRVEEID